mgnify:CR=1 FL=1
MFLFLLFRITKGFLMAKREAKVSELVSMIERKELRLPEMQCQYVWRSTRVRDLLCQYLT